MYAIISDGNHQYKVEEGQELAIDYRDMPPGEKITFEKVLAVGMDDDFKLGSPIVSGAKVTAEVLGPGQGEKLVVQKLRKRKNSRRKTGHRSMQTRVKIGKISS